MRVRRNYHFNSRWLGLFIIIGILLSTNFMMSWEGDHFYPNRSSSPKTSETGYLQPDFQKLISEVEVYNFSNSWYVSVPPKDPDNDVNEAGIAHQILYFKIRFTLPTWGTPFYLYRNSSDYCLNITSFYIESSDDIVSEHLMYGKIENVTLNISQVFFYYILEWQSPLPQLDQSFIRYNESYDYPKLQDNSSGISSFLANISSGNWKIILGVSLCAAIVLFWKNQPRLTNK